MLSLHERNTFPASSVEPIFFSALIARYKPLRIFILAVVLFIIGMSVMATRLHTTGWDVPLWVVIYPINSDNSQASSEYIYALEKEEFEPVSAFIAEEAAHYELSLDTPLSVNLAPEVINIPPKPPRKRNLLNVMWWSLKLRYWAYKSDTYEGSSPDIRLFLLTTPLPLTRCWITHWGSRRGSSASSIYLPTEGSGQPTMSSLPMSCSTR